MKLALNYYLGFTMILLSVINTSAQNSDVQRIIYDFTFQTDTNDVKATSKVQYALDIYDSYSRFVSIPKLQSDVYLDSLRKAIEAQGGIQNFKGSINVMGMPRGADRYVLYKFPDGKIKYQQMFLKTNYQYEEDLSQLNWQVTDSAEKYGQYDCQLAKVDYGGRKWNALFTTSIAINNGPYKFSGLPGLIVKMWDDKNQCLFELAEITKVNAADTGIPTAETVKKSDFKKLEANAQAFVSAAGSNTTNVIIRSSDGTEISQAEMQRRRAEREKKNNNRIELL